MQEQIDWKERYTEEEIEVAYNKWKKRYRPSHTHEPDATYIFHTALMEGDISEKNIFRVANRLSDRYRREVLKGIQRRVTLSDGRKVRRWEYPDDLLLNENVHTDYYNQHNRKASKTF